MEEKLLSAQAENGRLLHTNAALALLAKETTEIQSAWASAAAVQLPEQLAEKLAQLQTAQAQLLQLQGTPNVL